MREQQQRVIPQGNELQAQPIQSENLLKSDGKAHGSHICHSCHTHEDTEGHNNHEHKHEHHRHAHSSTKRQITLIAVTAVLLAAAVLIERYCALQTWQLLSEPSASASCPERRRSFRKRSLSCFSSPWASCSRVTQKAGAGTAYRI